jgi:exoribonuclease II
MAVMYTGKIIRFFEKRGLVAAVCLAQYGERMRLLCSDGTELILSTARVIHESQQEVDAAAAHDILLEQLQNNMDEQALLAAQVDSRTLWESVGAPGAYCEIPDLARAAFGESATSVHEAAVLAALVDDHVFFKLHNRQFLSYGLPEVQAQQQKKADEQERLRFIRQCIEWLQSVLAGREYPCDDSSECIELLKDYSAHGRLSPTWSRNREIFQACAITDERRCFDILVRLGVFGPDENLLLRRYSIPNQWPEATSRQVDSIGAAAICSAVNDPSRQDLTQLYVCSIDDMFTRDVDDAISFRFDGADLELGIHITDVSAFVEAATPIDAEAACRGSTLYIPEGRIPMLPPALSENIASLRVGERNPAISFLVRLSPEGKILKYRIVRSVVRIAERLTYADVDEAIGQGSDMARLHGFALALRAQRITAGAVFFSMPELQVRVDRSHDVVIKVRDRETPSQVLVSECMILANHCAAVFFADKRQPCLFRRQDEPLQRFIAKDDPALFEMFLQRRVMRRVEVTTAPGPHSSLGLACYTSITSPLRKYLDLVMQRQLSSLLLGRPPAYSLRELREVSYAVQPVLTLAGLVENERKRYWILKAMKSRVGNTLSALVLDRSHGMYSLLLPDFMLDVHVKEKDSAVLVPGSTVSAIIESVDPFAGSLVLKVIS